MRYFVMQEYGYKLFQQKIRFSMRAQNIVQLVIFLIGVICLVVSFSFDASSINGNGLAINTILLSIGCSIIAAVIINFVDYHITLPELATKNIIQSWKLISIYETKQKMNDKTNELLKAASEIDIAAFGCTGLINFQGVTLKKRLQKDLNIRFLIPDTNLDFIKQREKDENAVEGSIIKSIDSLISWVDETKKELSLSDGRILIKKYSCLPMDSIMIIDDQLFTGPFMIKKLSQLSMAYQYSKGGAGYEYYSEYFNGIWNDPKISEWVRK
ncbi:MULTISPECIES: hypothetical protein [Citrobacter]|uniref:hypothetical protein n=1 Tax=Citrobacter TaxID=544 RepID=UPI000E3D8882|nr:MULTISPECIES: hypothetical protein [Citrobacter]MBD0828191.1 hypothetical protein [Citrobacter sp. C1]RFU91873.1 hypothetical protein DZA29_10060 [Citrobacter gillenii]